MNGDELSELVAHVASEQDRALAERGADDAVRERLMARVANRPAGKSRRRWSLALVPALGVLAGLVAALSWPEVAEPSPLTFEVGGEPGALHAWASATGRELPILFSEGSRIALQPGARGRVIETTAYGADVIVEDGGASAAIVSKDSSAWRVRSGPFVVHVTGTRFDVHWTASTDTVRVRLYEGGVTVTGCDLGSGQRLTAGQQLEATCAEGRVQLGPIEPDGADDARVASARPAPSVSSTPEGGAVEEAGGDDRAAPPHVTSRSARNVPRVAEEPSWQSLAGGGRYAEACEEGRRVRPSMATDLLILGDACRLSGNTDGAHRAYAELRRTHAGSPDAARAGFELGRMSSRAGRAAVASRWYRTYLEEAPTGALAPAALGRLLESEIEAGRPDAAKRLAARYLARYPEGAHADAARKVLGTHEDP